MLCSVVLAAKAFTSAPALKNFSEALLSRITRASEALAASMTVSSSRMKWMS